MSFRRTVSGLSNSYLFFGVDAVVYLEGGSSFCREHVDQGSYTDVTADIRYWQTIFRVYRPNKSYKFCSIGSKETVKSIASDIKDGRINNVIVAMDRDFDHINEKLIISQNVIYTLGYSWENDAWNQISLKEAFCALSGVCKTKMDAESRIIDDYYKECSLKLSRAIRIDAILSQYDSSLFDRESYMRYVKIARNGKPIVNKDQIRNSLIKARQNMSMPIVRKTTFSLSRTPYGLFRTSLC